jgi:hypothetical protein
MSGTYLVCDLCGKFGPPAGFFCRDGVRLCYECYFSDGSPEKERQPEELEEELQEPAGQNSAVHPPG